MTLKTDNPRVSIRMGPIFESGPGQGCREEEEGMIRLKSELMTVCDDAYEERELRKAWKNDKPEFDRLKKLAFDLGVEKVLVVSSVLPSTGEHGVYIPAWEIACRGARLIPGKDCLEVAQKWGLSKRQICSFSDVGGPIILVDYKRQGLQCSALAHEIGHHICALAKFTPKEEAAPTTVAMRGLFPDDTYVHQNRGEIRAECFAEYLTGNALRKSVERRCNEVLRRLRLHDPEKAKLVEQHRTGCSASGI